MASDTLSRVYPRSRQGPNARRGSGSSKGKLIVDPAASSTVAQGRGASLDVGNLLAESPASTVAPRHVGGVQTDPNERPAHDENRPDPAAVI